MKFITLLAAGIVASALVGCKNVPTVTWQQQVAVGCAAVNTEIDTLQTAGVFTGGAQATLTNQIQPDVAKVCAQGATVTVANLQNVVNAVVPAVQTIVNNSSLSADDKNKAALAINGITLAVNTAIALYQAEAPAATAPAPASEANPASAVIAS